MYTFEYTLDEADYLEFNKFLYIESRETAQMKKIRKPVYFAIYFSFVAVLILSGITYEGLISVIMIALACVVATLMLFIIFWKRIALFFIMLSINYVKKDGKSLFGKENKIHFDEISIHEVTELAEIKVTYENVERIMEGRHAIYIFLNAIQAFIIPYRTFESKQQKTDFLFFIKEKVRNHN